MLFSRALIEVMIPTREPIPKLIINIVKNVRSLLLMIERQASCMYSVNFIYDKNRGFIQTILLIFCHISVFFFMALLLI
jgi:hypothetical protein